MNYRATSAVVLLLAIAVALFSQWSSTYTVVDMVTMPEDTNILPASFGGVVQYYTSIEIDAPVERVWETLVDLQSYPEWNPFLRSLVMVDPTTHAPLPNQTLTAGGTLEASMLMPPSMDSAKKPTVGYEQIAVVDADAHRLVWGGGRVPVAFRAEIAQALSPIRDGRGTRYETRDTFGGASGWAIRAFMGGTIKKCQEGMAEGLKKRVEESSK